MLGVSTLQKLFYICLCVPAHSSMSVAVCSFIHVTGCLLIYVTRCLLICPCDWSSAHLSRSLAVCSFIHATGCLLVQSSGWLSAHSSMAACSLIHGTCCVLALPWHLLLLIHCWTSSTYTQPQCGIFFQSQDFLHIRLLRKNILCFLTEKWNPD